MFKTSAELKMDAKNALQGRWKDAVLLNLIPSILTIASIWLVSVAFIGIIALSFVGFGSSTSYNNEFGDVYDESGFEDYLDEGDIDDLDGFLDEGIRSSRNSNFGINFGAQARSTLFDLVIGFMTIGISFTFVEILRDPNRKIRPGIDQFRMFNSNDFIPLLLTMILKTVFIWLWSLLLLIPGIIKGYAYSQAQFIYKDLSDHNDTKGTSVIQYITESKLLMEGHKGRLFYIDLSFLGWHILSFMTFGLGYLFLNPYINTTKAAFYRDLTKDHYISTGNAEETIGDEIDENEEWTSF